MAENPAKVRLVRCPKCENLLPEVTEFAVYQCGGCGAALRARNKHMESSKFSEESDEDFDEGVLEKMSIDLGNLDFSKKSVKNLSETDVKSSGSSSRRSEGDDSSHNSKTTQDFEYSEPHKIHSRRSIRNSNWRNAEKSFQDHRNIDVNAGSSSYNYRSRDEYVEVEDDRIELLRKLDELKDQIVRSRPLGEKSKEKLPTHYVDPPPYTRHSSQVHVFNDPFRPHNLGRASFPTSFEPNPYQPYFSGQFVGNEMAENQQFHHPSCSCLTCYHKHLQIPPSLPPPPMAPPVLQKDPNFHHQDYNRRFSTPNRRWSSEIRRPPRAILTTGGRRCHPVAGGSPFVACCRCFELLEMPKEIMKKTQMRMRCAGCSEVISLSFVDKKLVLSVYKEPRRDLEILDDNRNARGDPRWGSTGFSSEDYDNSGSYDFQSMDRLPLRGQNLTSAMRSIRSTSSCTSDDEIKHGIRDEPNAVDLVVEANKPSPLPTGSPLQDHFEYSTKYNRAGKGNESGRSNVAVEKVEGPVKMASVATEIEIFSNEYCINTGTSQESGDTNREVDQLRNNRGGESFFAGMIKKSFGEFSRSSQHADQEKVNVTVNGHPIPDHLVKRAEKLAGPIRPGEYWYDSRAGFWGMIGGPCRGIIPPFIEEFNFPMPENCADGNTNVYVNGRELHQKDLDLLAGRGLPTDEDRSYIVEISGRVLDKDSGQELRCLGKLAPTVESKRKGFGMKPARAAAA